MICVCLYLHIYDKLSLYENVSLTFWRLTKKYAKNWTQNAAKLQRLKENEQKNFAQVKVSMNVYIKF